MGNDYGRPRDVVGETRSAFTSHADSAFDVCFENVRQDCTFSPYYHNVLPLQASNKYPSDSVARAAELKRHIELDIDIGADAKDWSAIQTGERLKPTEAELRRVEETLAEVVKEMDYLREREHKLRDTNESTNERVKWFALGTMAMLVALGAWQVIYLRAYFRSKHLI